VAVEASRPLGLPGYDAALVDALEGDLEQARTALSALEEGAAGERLSRVHAQLLSHPHLPQAAFLMGECLTLEARAARERDPALALELQAERAALEGPRASAFGETTAAPSLSPQLSLTVKGLGPGDELELDGTSIATTEREVKLAAGLPKLTPCSAEDLSDAAETPHATPSGVACARWAKVRAERGGIGVALCEHDRCGAFVHWEQRAPAPFAPIAVEHRRWPSWAGFALAGAGVIAASSLVLWQAGAFDRGRPTAATWEYGGLNPQAIRF